MFLPARWPTLLRIALAALAGLWAVPMTLLGLLAGGFCLLLGARAKIGDGAVVFQRVPFGPGGALTLGNVILHTGQSLDERARPYDARHAGADEWIRIGDHERAHVYQYLALGVLFLPLYFAFGGVSRKNPFEQAADRYARTGRGWWPWPRDPIVASKN
jgi:hypothetical protein